MALKRSRSMSPTPPAKRQLPQPKVGYIAARRTGRLRGLAASVIPRPGTPPLSQQTLFRPSASPEPSDEPASPTERVRDDGGRKRKKALYLFMEELGQGHAHGVVSTYAVHRIDLARSQHGISVSGEEFQEPPVLSFKAAPGMAFLKARSMVVGVTDRNAGVVEAESVVGVTDRNAGVVEAESVVIDTSTWEVSAGPPPPSTDYGLVEVCGRIYAADMLTEDPRCVVLRSVATAARDAPAAGWTTLPRPQFRDSILALAAYPPRRGFLVSTEKGETFLLDGRRRDGAAWIALPGSSSRLPWEGERAVYAKEHGLWFVVSPSDGRLRAHKLDVVLGSGAPPRLEHKTHRVSDPVPVTTACGATPSAKLAYLGRSMFCIVQQADGRGADGCPVTVTVFRVIDSEMPVTLVERRRRRRRERGMNARWVAAKLERACADQASGSDRRRKLCRVNLWSRTYIARGGADRCPHLPGVLWM